MHTGRVWLFPVGWLSHEGSVKVVVKHAIHAMSACMEALVSLAASLGICCFINSAQLRLPFGSTPPHTWLSLNSNTVCWLACHTCLSPLRLHAPSAGCGGRGLAACLFFLVNHLLWPLKPCCATLASLPVDHSYRKVQRGSDV